MLKTVLKYLVPIAVIIIVFGMKAAAGLVLLLLYLAFLFLTGRAGLFGFIGSLRFARGSTEQALKWFRLAYSTGKAKPRTVISYAYLLLKSGHPYEAGQLLDSLLEKKPGRENELYIKSNLALVYWKRGELDAAVSTLEEVIREYRNTTVYGSLGYFLILKGDLDRALEFNLEAYDYNNSNAIILDNLAQNYFLKGMYDESTEIHEKLLALNPTFPEAYYNYALLLIVLGDNEKALEMLRKAQGSKFSYLSDVTPTMVSEKLKEVEGSLGE